MCNMYKSFMSCLIEGHGIISWGLCQIIHGVFVKYNFHVLSNTRSWQDSKGLVAIIEFRLLSNRISICKSP